MAEFQVGGVRLGEFNVIYSLPTGFGIVIVCAALALMTLAGFLVTERLIPLTWRKNHNEFVGFGLSVVGVVYAVVLAMSAVAVWENRRDADAVAHREANNLMFIALESYSLSASSGKVVRQSVSDYLHTVIDIEWPAQIDGAARKRAPDTEKLLVVLGERIGQLRAAEDREEPIIEKLQDVYHDLSSARQERQFMVEKSYCGGSGLFLFLGFLVTTSFTFLFGMPSRAMHLLVCLGVAMSQALVLAQVIIVDQPFRGPLGVTSEPYVTNLELISQIEQTRGSALSASTP